MRAADGRGGGKFRGGWEKRREVGLERWIGGRIGGIGLIWLMHAARENVRSIFEHGVLKGSDPRVVSLTFIG